MNALTTYPKPRAVGKSTAAVAVAFNFDLARARAIEQIEKADRAAQTAVDEAAAAGALLIEIREGLRGQALKAGMKFNTPNKPAALKFEVVMEEIAQATRRAPRTLYNWIGIAENGCKMLSEASIDIESLSVPVSSLLVLPEADVPEDAREARQLLFDWMNGKTINECLKGVVVDGDDASRLTRAHNGKTKGGAGGDRKDFSLFTVRKAKDMGVHLAHWDSMTETQKAECLTIAINMVHGDDVQLKRDGKTVEIELTRWPDDFAAAVLDALKDRFKKK